jgi:hypothetical protein
VIQTESMEHVSEILPAIAQAKGIVISKQRLRQMDGMELVRLKRDEGRQTLGFSSRPFVLCGLPIRKPPAGVLLHERRNGRFRLQITGHPEFGLPYGQDRLIPIFIATLMVQQKSRTIYFKSGAEMLETFGLPQGGKQYQRLLTGIDRIFGSTIFWSEQYAGSAKGVHRGRSSFLSETFLWNAPDLNQLRLPGDLRTKIVATEEFYNEVMAHRIPVDLEVVKTFAAAPAVLDLFLWLTYRCFTATQEDEIPLFGPAGLANQLGVVEYRRERAFRERLNGWLEAIGGAWPECPAHISEDGRSLWIAPAQAIHPRSVDLA